MVPVFTLPKSVPSVRDGEKSLLAMELPLPYKSISEEREVPMIEKQYGLSRVSVLTMLTRAVRVPEKAGSNLIENEVKECAVMFVLAALVTIVKSAVCPNIFTAGFVVRRTEAVLDVLVMVNVLVTDSPEIIRLPKSVPSYVLGVLSPLAIVDPLIPSMDMSDTFWGHSTTE